MTLQELYKTAVQDANRGQYAEAIRKLVLILTHEIDASDKANICAMLGAAYLTVGDNEHGVRRLEEALAVAPNNAAVWSNLSEGLRRLGRLNEAVGASRKAVALNPDYAVAHNNMGITLKEQGNINDAIASYRKALALHPQYVTAHNNMGLALNQIGEFDDAIVSYLKALTLKPDYAEAHNNMGLALKDQGNLVDSIASYRKALALKPDYAEAHNNMGNTFRDQGNLVDSIASFWKALALKPDYAEAHNNMGLALQDKGKLDDAVTSYRKALALKPDLAEAHNNMGLALKDQGNLVDAIFSYRKALTLKPNYDEAHYNLGFLLFQTNQYEKSFEHFKFSNFKDSKHYLLKILYIQNKKSIFFEQLEYFISQGEVHAVTGSLGCRSALRYGITKPNLFCKDPLNYVLSTDLSKQYDFDNIFVKTAQSILTENKVPQKRQKLLENGHQTYGNLFLSEKELTKTIQKIIRLEIEKYRLHYKHSNEGFLIKWPAKYSLYGWLINMKSGGKLRPHMHESGWVSGSIYINIPSNLKPEHGNIVVCIEEERIVGEKNNNKISIDVVTGKMCLFPASLLHYTIPFESEEERIVLAFDIIPEN